MSGLKRLIVEIHRRSIWQVLSIYVVGSWVAYQVVLGLVDGVGLPEWVPGMALVLILIGLPIVVATAFVQEGLPAREQPRLRDGGGAAPDSAFAADPQSLGGRSAAPADEIPQTSATTRSAVLPPRRTGLLERSLTWRRSLIAGVVAFALLGVGAAGWIGLRALGIGPMGSLVAAGVLDPSTRIVIADFDARGADTTLAGVVTEAFRIDFARSTLVRPAEPTAIREVLRRMQRPDVTRLDAELAREIALRAGISAFITGEVAAAGGGFVLTARLIAAESGEVLAAFREQARDEADVIRAIDRLSRSLRQRTGESLKAIHRSQPLEQVTTSSFEALQKFTRALRATGWEGDAARGTRLLEEAVALDSAFAAAHRALAIAHSNRDEPELALASIERALRFQDRLTDVERELAYGSYHSIRGEQAQSMAAYERALKIHPRQFAALNNLGLEHEKIFDYARAEAYLRRAVDADTGRFFGYTNLGELLVFVGRFDEAQQAFDAAVLRAPESAWPVVDRAMLSFARGDYDGTETKLRHLIDDARTNRGTRDRADVSLTHLLLMRGRLAEAERRVEALARATGDTDAVERRLASHRFHTSMWIRRDTERARAALRHGRSLAGDSADEGTFIEIATACALTGDVPCAREYLVRAGRAGPLQPWTNRNVFAAQGAIALAEPDFVQALRLLRAMQDRRCPRCEESLVGQVFEQMAQPDSAMAAYERYLAAPSLDRVFTDAYDRAFVLERLGALYEQRNERANAARYYAQLVALWKDADPELRPRVDEANRRLRLLQPDR